MKEKTQKEASILPCEISHNSRLTFADWALTDMVNDLACKMADLKLRAESAEARLAELENRSRRGDTEKSVTYTAPGSRHTSNSVTSAPPGSTMSRIIPPLPGSAVSTHSSSSKDRILTRVVGHGRESSVASSGYESTIRPDDSVSRSSNKSGKSSGSRSSSESKSKQDPKYDSIGKDAPSMATISAVPEGSRSRRSQVKGEPSVRGQSSAKGSHHDRHHHSSRSDTKSQYTGLVPHREQRYAETIRSDSTKCRCRGR
jgi:hypothetical protein